MKKPIVFFDGVCGLCNLFIDFVLAEDYDQVFLFAPLQSNVASQKLGPTSYNLQSIILLDDQKIYAESDAVFRIFEYLGGFWRALAYLKFVPRVMRNALYKFIAQHRYKFFGKRSTCRLPTPEQRKRFLLT